MGNILLSSSILSRFSDAHAVVVDEVSPGAIFQLVPFTRADFKKIRHTYSICSECGGRGVIDGDNGQPFICPKCKGKGGTTWADPEVQIDVFRTHVRGWSNVIIRNEDGQTEELPYSDEFRDSMATTPAYPILWMKMQELVGKVAEKASSD